jgi:hypothetical protein
MKKDYIRLLKKIFIIAVLLIVIDVLAGKLFQQFFYKLKSGESAQTTYAVTKANEQCVIFGSSRAVHHYIPSVVEDTFALSCYNAGKDGQGILYQYAVLKSMLSRTTPRVIILDVDADEFVENEAGYGRLSALLPYYYYQKEVQDVVNERSPYEPFKALSGLYRYNSLLLNTVFGSIKQENDGIEKGYKPLDKIWNKPMAEGRTNKKEKVDSIKIEYFKNFITEAKKQGTAVYVVVSPVFETQIVKPSSLQIAEDLCKQEEVPFINVRQESAFISHPEYFADIEHLNESGAGIYSKFICNRINELRKVR